MAKSVIGLLWMWLVAKIVLIATLRVFHHYIIGGPQHAGWRAFVRVSHPCK
jgi:hypothetical protein